MQLQSKKFTRALILGAIAIGSLVLAGCSSGGATPSGSASDKGITIDVGSTKLHFPAGTKPNIAMFAGSGIAYQTAYQKEYPILEKKYGVKITYFDSKFDPTTQLNELRTALQNKTYNAWIVENYAGTSSCTLLTKQAPAAGIVVSMISDPTCDAPTQPFGEKYWTAGTLNTVGAWSSVTYYTNWAREAKALIGKSNPKVVLLNGPPLVPATQNLDAAMKTNGITPVADLNTDYGTQSGLTGAGSALQAHHDIDAFLNVGPDVTTGVVSALKAAGYSAGQVKVFDIGGASQNDTLTKEGWLTMSVPYAPKSGIDTAVQQIVLAFQGKQGPHFLPALNKGTPTNPFQITKSSEPTYKYEY